MYFIRTDETDPQKLEMSFNLSKYQPHLAGKRSIYQSIFLDERTNRKLCGGPPSACTRAQPWRSKRRPRFGHSA